MRWIPDRSGRFRWRPYYTTGELDQLCETRITTFLMERYGAISYPITTNDLSILLEQEVDDLDMYADLTAYGCDVEGMTSFFVGAKPRVLISKKLTLGYGRELRLRTTLAHELGHVLLHDLLGRRDAAKCLCPFRNDPCSWPVSHPATARAQEPAHPDWMEWQANYASGAFLMPRSAVRQIIESLSHRISATSTITHPDVLHAIHRIRQQFLISEAAARVRLRQLGLPEIYAGPL